VAQVDQRGLPGCDIWGGEEGGGRLCLKY
jgi:hypothetical protein